MSNAAITAVLDKSKAKGTARLVLLILADYASEDGQAWPSTSTIASKANTSKRNVLKTLSILEDKGEITRLGIGLRGVIRYHITVVTGELEDTGEPQDTSELEDTTTGEPQDTGSGELEDTQTLTNPLEEPLSISPPDDFEEFWKIYPLHIAKKKAKQKFETIIKRNEATPSELIDGAKGYAKQVKDKEREFIAHPTTWLNQGRWEDEYEPPERSVWDVKMEFWEKGRWIEEWGPKPGEPGCEVPAEYLVTELKERTG